MSSSTALPDVDAYLAAVRAALEDLPPAERDDLLAEVEVSIVEAAGEGEAAVAARLGPPHEFAAELRAAAGINTAPPTQREPLLRRAAAWSRRAPRLRSLWHVLVELAPVWWVARAYILVAAIALAADAAWSTGYPFVPRLHNGAIGLLAIVIAAVTSIWFALRARRHALYRRFAPIADLVLVVLLIPVAMHFSNVAQARVRAAAAPPIVIDTYRPGLVYNGAPVSNIYPYTRRGRLLHDVLLYDGAGRPLTIAGAIDPNRRVLRTRDGNPVFNAFPIRYYDPGTLHVSRPDAAPPATIPRIVTPPLRP
jgi:uncharacterized membrane protein